MLTACYSIVQPTGTAGTTGTQLTQEPQGQPPVKPHTRTMQFTESTPTALQNCSLGWARSVVRSLGRSLVRSFARSPSLALDTGVLTTKLDHCSAEKRQLQTTADFRRRISSFPTLESALPVRGSETFTGPRHRPHQQQQHTRAVTAQRRCL